MRLMIMESVSVVGATVRRCPEPTARSSGAARMGCEPAQDPGEPVLATIQADRDD
jgi:hypothetical protein